MDSRLSDFSAFFSELGRKVNMTRCHMCIRDRHVLITFGSIGPINKTQQVK